MYRLRLLLGTEETALSRAGRSTTNKIKTCSDAGLFYFAVNVINSGFWFVILLYCQSIIGLARPLIRIN